MLLALLGVLPWRQATAAPANHAHDHAGHQNPALLRRAHALLRAAAARQQAALLAQREADIHAAHDRARARALSEAARDAALLVRQTDRDEADTLAQIDGLGTRQRDLQAELARDCAALAPMLPVIGRLSLYPSETLLATPASPSDALSGLMLLRGLGMQLERQAEAIRVRQLELARLADRMQSRTEHLASLRLEQQARGLVVAARATQAEADQRASADVADAAARAAAASASQADGLQDAVARLQAIQQDAQHRFQAEAEAADAARQPKRARAARDRAASLAGAAGPGLLPGPGSGAPVAGAMVQQWGASTAAGPATGITYAPPPLATVVAPCQGRIDFASPFRSYGQMLILDCGHGYRFVLAGMARLDVAPGQHLARGAPLGRMPDWNLAGAGRPSLYLQLRQGTETIDPAVFLRPRS